MDFDSTHRRGLIPITEGSSDIGVSQAKFLAHLPHQLAAGCHHPFYSRSTNYIAILDTQLSAPLFDVFHLPPNAFIRQVELVGANMGVEEGC